MNGRRVYAKDDLDIVNFLKEPGDYGEHERFKGLWFMMLPTGNIGCIYDKKTTGKKEHHSVTEHEDGTITVNPSILHNAEGKYHNPTQKTWHGYLERGIWRTC